MLKVLKNANLTLAFLMELAMIVALAYTGFIVGAGLPLKIVLGLGLPILVIIIWALFGAPASRRRWKGAAYWLLRIVLFGGTALALYLAGQPVLGIVFALLFVLNMALVYAWHQE